jgi:subfamily B ATP-binding cassette protein HlyB/CyaB
VIDKVLVNRSMGTLDVLVIGLVTISIFETILGILRTFVFAHTTNRIDVELGSRLFRHLTALPIAYFQARRVGDSVARVRSRGSATSSIPHQSRPSVPPRLRCLRFGAISFLSM